MVVLTSERDELITLDIQAKREDNAASISIPDNVNSTEGYAFWSSQDDLSFSPSVYWRV